MIDASRASSHITPISHLHRRAQSAQRRLSSRPTSRFRNGRPSIKSARSRVSAEQEGSPAARVQLSQSRRNDSARSDFPAAFSAPGFNRSRDSDAHRDGLTAHPVRGVYALNLMRAASSFPRAHVTSRAYPAEVKSIGLGAFAFFSRWRRPKWGARDDGAPGAIVPGTGGRRRTARSAIAPGGGSMECRDFLYLEPSRVSPARFI